MKIVVIGGTGLIGSQVVSKLRQQGHEVIAASPSVGINTITGEGLDTALENAQVVIDLANSPSFEEKAVMTFFETAGKNLFPVEISKGVKHHIALSIVGTERLTENGYFRAKLVQEKLIKESGVPYSIVHSTQFFEFLDSIALEATSGVTVTLPTGAFQPIASADVAAVIVKVANAEPINGMIEIAGPERLGMDVFIKRFLGKMQDPRKIVSDAKAKYFGSVINDQSIVPGEAAIIGSIDFETWFNKRLATV